MSLRNFCAMVGRAAFGLEWDDDDVVKVNFRLDQRPSDDPGLRHWFVAEQVLLALQTSVIRAGLRLDPEHQILKAAVRQTSPKDSSYIPNYFEDLNDSSDAIEDLNPIDDPTVQIIDAGYWLELENLSASNVNLSHCEVSLDYVHYLGLDEAYHPLMSKKDDAEHLSTYRGVIFIIDAYRALRNMNRHKIDPGPEWFSRYNSYRNRILDEVVAAAWRFIVIKKIDNVHGRKIKIIEAMRDYLTSQGLTGAKGVSDKVLEVLAGKIVRQWRDNDVNVLTLLNSTPEPVSREKKRKS